MSNPTVQRMTNTYNNVASVVPQLPSAPKINFMVNDVAKPLLTNTYKSLQPGLKYIDPRGYQAERQNPNIGNQKFFDAAKSVPGAAWNIYSTGKNTVGTALTSAGFGGAMNLASGGSFAEGAKKGLETSSQIAGIGSFTNPLIAGFANKTTGLLPQVASKLDTNLGKQLINRVSTGIGNIPEGYLMNKSLGRTDYGVGDAAFDFGTGAVFGSHVEQPNVKSIGRNPKGLHPEDVDYLDRSVDILRNSKANSGQKATATQYIDTLAEKYLNKADIDNVKGDTMKLVKLLQKKAGDIGGAGSYSRIPGLNLVEPKVDVKGGKVQVKMKNIESNYTPITFKDGKVQVKSNDERIKDLITNNNLNKSTIQQEAEKITSQITKEANTQLGQTLKLEMPASNLSSIKNNPVSSQGIKGELEQMNPSIKQQIQQPSLMQSSKGSETSFQNNSFKSGLAKIGKPTEQLKNNNIIDKVKQMADDVYTQAVDRFNPLTKLSKKGGQDNAMRKAITAHYGAGSTGTYHVDFELAPILRNKDTNDLRAYTIAQRDMELAERGIKGSDSTAAKQVIDELTKKYGGNISELEDTAQQLYKYQQNMVKKYLVDSGVISKESYEAMLKDNKKYVPFKRVMDEMDEFLGMAPAQKGVGSVGSQNLIKGIKGSDRDIIDPLQSIVENTYKMVGLGQRNKVAKAIVSLKDQLPDVIKPFEGEVGNKPVISVFENGKVQKYLVPPDVAEAAKGLQEETMNTIVKILAIPTKLFRATATGLNPEFMLPNVARDLQSAFVNVGLNPLNFVQGMMHLFKKDEVYQDFLKAGGQTSSIALDRKFLEQRVEDIADSFNPTEKSTLKAAVKFPIKVVIGATTIPANVVKRALEVRKPSDMLNIVKGFGSDVMNTLQTIGEYSEQPTRIAMYKKGYNKAIKKGLSREEAMNEGAYAAQEGTVNFARRGSKMQAANALVAFFNARLQGTDKLLRSLKENPVGAGFRLALITQAPAVLSYAWNRQFESFNDENVLTKYDKDNNFILMLSDTPIEELGGAQYIKIPKAEVGKFANPTESFLAYLDNKGDNESLDKVIASFKGLSPAQSLGDIVPTSLKPAIENAANYSFFKDQEIVPEYKKNLPAAYQTGSKTPAAYQLLGKKLNMSPAKLENLGSGYLTGYEKLAMPFLNDVAKKIDPTLQESNSSTSQDVNRIPIARRFLGGEKRTKEEQEAMNLNQAKSINYKIQDIKSAMKNGTVPEDVGQMEIDKLQKNQNDIIDKTNQRGKSIKEIMDEERIQTNIEEAATPFEKYKALTAAQAYNEKQMDTTPKYISDAQTAYRSTKSSITKVTNDPNLTLQDKRVILGELYAKKSSLEMQAAQSSFDINPPRKGKRGGRRRGPKKVKLGKLRIRKAKTIKSKKIRVKKVKALKIKKPKKGQISS